MNTNKIMTIGMSAIIVVLAGSNVYLVEKLKERPDRTAEIAGLQSQLEDKKQALVKSLEDSAKQDEKAIQQTVCGIYQFEPPHETSQELDLRSDSSALARSYFNDQTFRKKKLSWKLNDNSVEISDGRKFNIEGDDLIDSHGNRWLRSH